MSKKLTDAVVALKALVGMDAAATKQELEASYAKNANEVMHTGNTGAGAEFVPEEVHTGEIIDMVPNYSILMDKLPGNHGSGLPMKETTSVIGEADLFEGNSEWTTGAATPNTPTGKKVASGKVTIEQAPFILEIAISKRELNYAPAQLEGLIRTKIAKSMARTIDAFFLNADTATSGNVNLDGGTPAATSYYLKGNNGIRKVGIANTVVNVGTMDEDDLLALIDKLGEYGADLPNLLFVVSRNVYNKMLGFSNLKTYDKAKDAATIARGILANVWGVDILVARDMPATSQADGKVGDGTSGHTNTVGQIALLWTPAVQYGFGQELEIEVTKVAGKGTVLTATFEFGFTIVDEEVGQSKTVALGANVTL